jgi:hypothetical protein
MTAFRGLQLALLCVLVALASGCGVIRGTERGMSNLIFSSSMERQLGVC